MSFKEKPMAERCLTKNPDGTFTIKGSGWFWVRLNAAGNVLEMAKGMNEKAAARLFIREAKMTLEKYKNGIQ